MEDILKGKGEGVMIKDPKSFYEGVRSYSLLKVKRFEDAEAKVIGH
jgi:DNA ligase 1